MKQFFDEDTKLVLELYNDQDCYTAGQQVEGCVKLFHGRTQDVKLITIAIQRKTEIDLTQDELHQATSRIYTLQLIKLAENCGYEKRVYPFSFNLPVDLPSSFVHASGSVSYILKVELRTYSEIVPIPQTVEMPINIHGVLDLNQVSNARKKQSICQIKSEGKFSFLADVKKSGFVPGESVHITCQFSNNMKKEVKSVTASFKQVINFYGEGKPVTCATSLYEIQCPKLLRGCSCVNWSPKNFRVPPVPPTRVGDINVMDVEYFIEFNVVFGGIMSNKFVRQLPITIGTVPIRELSIPCVVITDLTDSSS